MQRQLFLCLYDVLLSEKLCPPPNPHTRPPSPNACVHKAISGSLRGFLAAYGIKAVLNALLAGFSKRSLSAALRALADEDPLRFGASLGGLVGVYGAVRCALSHMRGKDDRINSAVAGGGALVCRAA